MDTDKAHLLIVEDDDQLAELLIEYLGQQGFELSRVASGDVAAEKILKTRPDLVILDLMLPGANGLDVCREVRDSYSGSILMLTASQSEADHVAGLELGADDFVNKPIEPRVLLARIRAQLRRLNGGSDAKSDDEGGILRVGSLQVDIASRDVSVEGELVPLTTMEFDVLLRLALEAGSVVKRDDLYTQVMGIEYDGIDRGMDVHVSRIRRKLQRAGFDSSRLKSVRGVGYLLASR
ncbi:MAG: response regulator transcription factor [Myxococcales bacterium]|nr:response regulator transcription factor [Deltaproteobacteria bacterium]NNE19941.1 response regulator transcription factor [Myxococcales bacterium]